MARLDQLQAFMPHGVRFLGLPDLMFLRIAPDALTALAYFTISFGIIRFVCVRGDLDARHRAAAISFAACIMLCGLTYVASIVALWFPYDVTEGWLKMVTAAVSIGTAAFVLSIIPQLQRLPSAKALQREIDEHTITLAALGRPRAELARRVDLTEEELRHAERQYAASDKLLRAVIETVPGLIYAKDKLGRMILANKNTLNVIGKPWTHVQGRTDADFLDDKGQAAAVMSNDRHVMALDREQEIEEVIDHPTKGTRIWLSTKLPLREASGAVTGIVGVSLDVTDRKRLQADLNHVARVSAMGDMATALAHELNQPLGAIMLYLEGVKTVLHQTSPQHPALKPVDLAHDQCIRAGDIIRRVRAFVSGGDVIRQREKVSDVVDDACVLAMLGGCEHNVKTLIEHASLETYAVMDKVEIQQVLVNLVRNALDAIPLDGEHRLVIRTGRDAQWNAVVSVEDTGCGIADDIRDGLFQPFHSTKGTKGMGIGLSLCRTIIEAHGGTISGRQNAKTGATFSFTLPAMARGAVQ